MSRTCFPDVLKFKHCVHKTTKGGYIYLSIETNLNCFFLLKAKIKYGTCYTSDHCKLLYVLAFSIKE